MLHGATAVTVAVMIVPLHTIYPPVAGVASLTDVRISGLLQRHPKTQFGWKKSGPAAYPPGDLEPQMESSATREYPSLIDTFFVTHTVNGEEMLRLQVLSSNTSSGVPYTDEEINALAQRASSGGTFPVLVGYCRDGPQISLFRPLRPRLNAHTTQMLNQYESTPEFGSGSGGCGDDEMANDEESGEDAEDGEDGDS
ncbi:hypothetical protein Tco_0127101 [Tanacetum coccineum]